MTMQTPKPNQLPTSPPLLAALVSTNGVLSVSVAGLGPDVEVEVEVDDAPDSVFERMEVRASPRTVVEVRNVVVLSSDVKGESDVNPEASDSDNEEEEAEEAV